MPREWLLAKELARRSNLSWYWCSYDEVVRAKIGAADFVHVLTDGIHWRIFMDRQKCPDPRAPLPGAIDGESIARGLREETRMQGGPRPNSKRPMRVRDWEATNISRPKFETYYRPTESDPLDVDVP
jgi:hypothetical protein